MNKKLSEEQEKKAKEEFESFKEKDYSEEDMHKVFENEENIIKKILSDENLKKFINEVRLFFSMLKDFFTRTYTEAPVGTIMAIVGSLLYVLWPFDLIPDFIPVAGYLDDAAVLGACLKAVKTDLERYKAFKGLF